jgi:hypothetical protein
MAARTSVARDVFFLLAFAPRLSPTPISAFGAVGRGAMKLWRRSLLAWWFASARATRICLNRNDFSRYRTTLLYFILFDEAHDFFLHNAISTSRWPSFIFSLRRVFGESNHSKLFLTLSTLFDLLETHTTVFVALRRFHVLQISSGNIRSEKMKMGTGTCATVFMHASKRLAQVPDIKNSIAFSYKM